MRNGRDWIVEKSEESTSPVATQLLSTVLLGSLVM